VLLKVHRNSGKSSDIHNKMKPSDRKIPPPINYDPKPLLGFNQAIANSTGYLRNSLQVSNVLAAFEFSLKFFERFPVTSSSQGGLLGPGTGIDHL
jgi:hypothetical protein